MIKISIHADFLRRHDHIIVLARLLFRLTGDRLSARFAVVSISIAFRHAEYDRERRYEVPVPTMPSGRLRVIGPSKDQLAPPADSSYRLLDSRAVHSDPCVTFVFVIEFRGPSCH